MIARSKPGRSRFISERHLAGEMTGELRITREACSGDSWKMLRSAPRQISSDMTMASRSGSIGGLVTCANCWRK
ncbi:hypothetical protein D3C84_578530 [compost metagenome]